MSVGSYFIEDYDSGWEQSFRTEQGTITAAFNQENVLLEHIGSTAVPGLGAKPIVDMMLGVYYTPSVSTSSNELDVLEKLGYVCDGSETAPGTLYCRKAGPVRANLHLTKYEGGFWKDNLIFRNYLRVNADVATEYEALKRTILKDLGDDPSRELYNQRKERFILDVLKKASDD
jgi:GrpB-like predicted nucleotidyltransferase (UPF0157 family)